MADEVYMDIPQVQEMVKSFQTFGDVLDGIAKALEALALALHGMAWISFGATEALAKYLDSIKPNFDKAAAKMRELSSDITGAIKAYAEGDRSGSQRFAG